MMPIYVLATDGRLYQDPRIGRSHWCLYFTDKQLATIRVEWWRSANESRHMAERLLVDNGVIHLIRGERQDAKNFYLDVEIVRPVPHHLLAGQKSVLQPPRQAVVVDFGRT